MEREDTLSKMVPDTRMPSDFSLASTSLAPPSGEDDSSLFLARKKSSLDFTDLEILLAQTRNPVLTQLHRAYSAQFEVMTQQIAALNRQVAELKLQAETQRFERQISLDVFSQAPSDGIGHSRQVSRISSTWKTTPMEIRPAEPPFWRDQLQRAGEEWDQGLESFKRGSLRCISPMTRC
jgi:hypothetical protein